eukprot:gene7030-2257_t
MWYSYYVSHAVTPLLALLPLSAGAAGVAAVLFFAGQWECAVVDILCQGRYATLMQRSPETGADLVTWVWFSFQTGSLVAFSLLGPMVDALDPRAIFLVAAPFAAQE